MTGEFGHNLDAKGRLFIPFRLREELGDVLLQVVFHCQIERENQNFVFNDVCDEVCKKLIIRHPHVFGDVVVGNTEDVLKNWDSIKKETKGQESYTDTLKSVAKSLPALMRAQKVGKRAMRAGMDFSSADDAVACIAKEKAEFDEAKKRIALGLKQLQAHPWEALNPDLKVGDVVEGKVVVIADYGAFVEIQPGVEGLIHVSEMSWSLHLRSAQDFLKVGDVVKAVVLTLDRDERKMSLGIKQLKADPWADITVKYPINSKHTATVRNFTNFGVFVELEEGVDGLIHISDLSWTKKIKHPNEFTQIGAEIEVVVLEIDKENRRLSLGHKQLEENPWEELAAKFGVDTVVEGKIVELSDKGAVVSLEDGVEAFCTARHLQKEDKEAAAAKQGDVLDFKVIEFNKDAKRILVSHLRTWEARPEAPAKETKAAAKKEAAPEMPKVEKTTLGDLDVLANLKAAMTEETPAEKPAKKAPAKKTAAKKTTKKAEEAAE